MDTDNADTTNTESQNIDSATQNTETAAGPPEQPQAPTFTPEAAAALDAAYALTEPDNPQGAPTQQDKPTATNSEQADYSITFPENFAQDSEAQAFNDILAPIAKQSGIDGEAFGKLFAESYAAIESARQQAEWKNRFQQDQDLKKDWGADYESNMKTARSHIAFLKQKAGLSDSDLAVFSSPKGMRALYAMATAHAAPPAAGLEQTSLTEKSWAQAVMQPGHADHAAFIDPLNPRYREVNQRWLRANGQ